MCQTHTCTKCAKMSATAYKALARIDTMWFCTPGCIGQGNNNTEPKAGLSNHDMEKLETSISSTVQKMNMSMYHHHHHLPYSTGHFFSVLRTGLYASSPEPHECHGNGNGNGQANIECYISFPLTPSSSPLPPYAFPSPLISSR